MELLTKLFEIRLAKSASLQDLIETYFSKNLARNETRLRYFIVSSGKKSLKVEATFLRE
ncbi:MAG: hypothetical protein Q7R70_01335 [Candidatus Diapherotrites archaeon]|nr:hypothetical protein [Candidatus Diapherotrites archaeon]